MFQPKTVGIIGYLGRMAQGIFLPFFWKMEGVEVIGSDSRGSELTNQEVAERSDLLIILVPIMKTARVIRGIIPHMKPGAVLLHGASVQEPNHCHLTEILHDKRFVKKSVTTGFWHFKVGPATKSLRGQSAVIGFVNEPTPEPRRWLKDVLEREKVFVWETNPAFHDWLTAKTQVEPMLRSLVAAKLWAHAGLDPAQALRISGPPAWLQATGVIRSLTAPEVVADILVSHPHTLKTISQMQGALREVKRLCGSKNATGLVTIAREGLASIPEADLKRIAISTERHIRLEGDMRGGAICFLFSEAENRLGLGAGVMSIFDRYEIAKTSTEIQTLPDGGCVYYVGVEDPDSPDVSRASNDVLVQFGGKLIAAVR